MFLQSTYFVSLKKLTAISLEWSKNYLCLVFQIVHSVLYKAYKNFTLFVHIEQWSANWHLKALCMKWLQIPRGYKWLSNKRFWRDYITVRIFCFICDNLHIFTDFLCWDVITILLSILHHTRRLGSKILSIIKFKKCRSKNCVLDVMLKLTVIGLLDLRKRNSLNRQFARR